MYTGVFVVVGGLSKAHAVTHEYSWSSSTRFAWSLGYVALMCVAAYSVGLPEQPRTRRGAVFSALIAAGIAAIAMSVVQLFLGDALLPRFVVLGSAVILVPWLVLCAVLSRDVDARAGERDRVVVVATVDEMDVLEADLAHASSGPLFSSDGFRPMRSHEWPRTPARPLWTWCANGTRPSWCSAVRHRTRKTLSCKRRSRPARRWRADPHVVDVLRAMAGEDPAR